jgi:predicted enzyme related to lactoylglutathione lyase
MTEHDREIDMEITDVIVDCADPHRLAQFWAELLGRSIGGSKGPYVWLQRTDGGLGVGFQKVAEAKQGKNRFHLDIATSDLVAGMRRIEGLGGHRVEGFESGGFLVMADPEGNEFCLIPSAPFELDENGTTDYLDQVDLTSAS